MIPGPTLQCPVDTCESCRLLRWQVRTGARSVCSSCVVSLSCSFSPVTHIENNGRHAAKQIYLQHRDTISTSCIHTVQMAICDIAVMLICVTDVRSVSVYSRLLTKNSHPTIHHQHTPPYFPLAPWVLLMCVCKFRGEKNVEAIFCYLFWHLSSWIWIVRWFVFLCECTDNCCFVKLQFYFWHFIIHYQSVLSSQDSSASNLSEHCLLFITTQINCLYF